MFEKILSPAAIKTVERLSADLNSFYLAGGTGLALQLGHRKSDDFDFFSDRMFNTDSILASVAADKVLFTELGTIHCEVRGIRITFLYYEVPLTQPAILWRGIKIAHLKDIAAEKIKTISQRGSKKDFIDLYAVIKLKSSIKEACELFKNRFKRSDINYYHVVKSLIFFEDAEQEPSPLMLLTGEDWKWEKIKAFFFNNIGLFENEFGV
ncbi:MAG: nucleotidyl transferase AbiEii/AbiGii toxin family protein [Desulfobacterales bacterium]